MTIHKKFNETVPGGDGMGEAPTERPWIALSDSHDVEAWIDHFNRDLQRHVGELNAGACGVCFQLAHGGQIFMHTTEGAILLDVTPEAEWAAPVISAATGVEAPGRQIWTMPDDRLTELVLGLSSLIATTRLVVGHNFRARK